MHDAMQPGQLERASVRRYETPSRQWSPEQAWASVELSFKRGATRKKDELKELDQIRFPVCDDSAQHIPQWTQRCLKGAPSRLQDLDRGISPKRRSAPMGGTSIAPPQARLQLCGESIDLRNMVRRSGVSIEPGLSIERVFQLFNGMPARYLPVVDSKGGFQGIITRKRMVLCQWNMESQSDAPGEESGSTFPRL